MVDVPRGTMLVSAMCPHCIYPFLTPGKLTLRLFTKAAKASRFVCVCVDWLVAVVKCDDH